MCIERPVAITDEHGNEASSITACKIFRVVKDDDGVESYAPCFALPATRAPENRFNADTRYEACTTHYFTGDVVKRFHAFETKEAATLFIGEMICGYWNLYDDEAVHAMCVVRLETNLVKETHLDAYTNGLYSANHQVGGDFMTILAEIRRFKITLL